MKNTLKKHA